MLSAIRTYNHLTSSHRQIKAAVQRVLASPYRTQLVDRLLHQIETKYLKSTTTVKSFWSDWYSSLTSLPAAPVYPHYKLQNDTRLSRQAPTSEAMKIVTVIKAHT